MRGQLSSARSCVTRAYGICLVVRGQDISYMPGCRWHRKNPCLSGMGYEAGLFSDKKIGPPLSRRPWYCQARLLRPGVQQACIFGLFCPSFQAHWRAVCWRVFDAQHLGSWLGVKGRLR